MSVRFAVRVALLFRGAARALAGAAIVPVHFEGWEHVYPPDGPRTGGITSMRSMMVRMAVVVALAVGGLAAVVSAGPDKPIPNVKTLAGEWRAAGDASKASIRIKGDGTYEGTSANGKKTTGQVTATGGKASFKSATAAGSVTLSQEGGKDMLTFVSADGRSSAKLQRVK